MDRYEVRQTGNGRWAIFDTQTASWPGIIAGKPVNWSTDSPELVRPVADKMNRVRP